MATAKQIKKARARKVRPVPHIRQVTTVYYADTEGLMALRTTQSEYPINAANRAGLHLRRQTYPGAVVAEVFDGMSGRVYGIVVMDETGNTHSLYEDVADLIDFKHETRRKLRK